MADVTKLTFETKIVASVVAGAVMMTATVIGAWNGVNNKIDRLASKIELNDYKFESRLNVVEAIIPQVNINTMTIKTIADFIEPKRIEISKRR